MKQNTQVRGIIPALITPMMADEALDEKGLATLINIMIDAGVHGVFVAGTAGEAWALDREERKRIIEIAVAANQGRVPVYAGTGANTTVETIRLSVMARDAGADILSVITPNVISPSQAELFDHFQAVAEAVDLPILLYDIPARTGNELSVDLVVRLSEACGNIAGIKDSTGNFSKTMEYLRRLSPSFHYIMGNDNLILPALRQGAAAAIAATASVMPEPVVAIYDQFQAGDMDAALACQHRIQALRQAFSLGTHPAMLKAGCELLYNVGGPPRRPVLPLDAGQRETLKEILDGMKR